MKKINKILMIFCIVVFIAFIMFRNLSFGSSFVVVNNKKIDVIRYYFNLKQRDNNISIKSFQSNRVVKKELSTILSNYKKIHCDDKDYYYNEKEGYTIIDYGVNNNFVYNTIYMKYFNYNYCDYLKLEEYTEKLNGYALMRAYSPNPGETNNVSVVFIVKGFNEKIVFEADLKVKTNSKVLESSEGSFEIIDDKLTYTRTNIREKSDEVDIPKTSVFTILQDGILKLEDTYLSKYEKEIILK